MKTLLTLLLLAGSAVAGETPLVTAKAVRSTLTISAPTLEAGYKYGRVSISANGSNLDHTQIASNKWTVIVPSDIEGGEFSAIVCGRDSCRPVDHTWVAEPWNLVPIQETHLYFYLAHSCLLGTVALLAYMGSVCYQNRSRI